MRSFDFRSHKGLWLLALVMICGLLPAAPAGAQSTPGGSRNVHLMGSSPKAGTTNSDLAFWGKLAVAGNYDGFRILDISEPDNPRVLKDVACRGPQGDVSIWGDLVFVSVDRPQTSDDCTGSEDTDGRNGFEGIRIFDIGEPTEPQFVTAVPTDCGSHTHTLVPDPANSRVLLYVSSYPASFRGQTPYGTICHLEHSKISVVAVPLDNPAAAAVIAQPTFTLDPFFSGNIAIRGCHDINVLLETKRAAAACLSEAQIWDISDPVNPVTLARIDHPAVEIWHSAAFTWDGKVVAFGDEAGGGVEARCTDPRDSVGRIWFYDVEAPTTPLGSFKAPRAQPDDENCTAHNFNVIPRRDRYQVIVSAWYQAGTAVVDFTDPAGPHEVGYYDFERADPRGGAWSSYWYNNFIYASDMTRGLFVFNLSDRMRAGAERMPRMNPQTQEPLRR